MVGLDLGGHGLAAIGVPLDSGEVVGAGPEVLEARAAGSTPGLIDSVIRRVEKRQPVLRSLELPELVLSTAVAAPGWGSLFERVAWPRMPFANSGTVESDRRRVAIEWGKQGCLDLRAVAASVARSSALR